jgi:hypothetical protein
MGSGALIYGSVFIKTGSAIQNLMGDAQTHGSHKSAFIFLFKISKASYKNLETLEGFY